MFVRFLRFIASVFSLLERNRNIQLIKINTFYFLFLTREIKGIFVLWEECGNKLSLCGCMLLSSGECCHINACKGEDKM